MPEILKFLQEKVVFLPVRLPQDFHFEFSNVFEELYLETPHGGKINALHFKLEKPKGVLLYFHGNAGNLNRWGKIAAEFTKFGYDVLVPDYRGYGKSTGPRNEEFLYADAQYCYDFLKKKYGEENMVVYGRSLGGTFAIKTAAQNSPKKLVLECTFFNLQDLVNRWLPNSATDRIAPKMTYLFLSNENIVDVHCPVYHFHGDRDKVVPLSSGKKLFETFENAHPRIEKKFVEIKNGTHDDLMQFDIFAEELRKILD